MIVSRQQAASLSCRMAWNRFNLTVAKVNFATGRTRYNSCCPRSTPSFFAVRSLSSLRPENVGATGGTTACIPRAIQDDSTSFKVIKVFYNGASKKSSVTASDLLRSSRLHARDLLEFNLTSQQDRRKNRQNHRRYSMSRRDAMAIVPRPESILVSFGRIRAVISRTHVLLLNGHDPAVTDFALELKEVFESNAADASKNGKASKTLLSSNAGFFNTKRAAPEAMELVFLEEVLRETLDSFHRRLQLFEPITNSFLERATNEVYSDTGVHQLGPLKDALQSFELTVKQCLDCLTHLLQNDELMLDLLLTEQAQAQEDGSVVDFSRHEHVELLLGVYSRQLSNTLMEIRLLLQRLQSKQEFVALALAGYRNRMVRMNVTVAICGLSFAMGTSVAGFFGMNLVSGLEDHPTAFQHVILSSAILGAVVGGTALNYLSGRTMRARANLRLQEIETLSGALSEMGALDYAVKHTLGDKEACLSKEQFANLLCRARASGEIPQAELDLLFDVLDTVRDGQITNEDFAKQFESNGGKLAKFEVKE